MKKIILILCVLLFAFTAKAQVINVCGTDSVTLEVDNYVNGTIEWQESIDTITWATIPEVSGITYRFLPTQTKYYRAVVKTTDCQPLYSAISLVQLIPIANAGTDRTIGNTSMTLLGNAVPGATGEWTILSGNGGVLDNPANPRALLTGINKETYTLKWTLTNACGQSSDTVVITFDQIIAKNNFIVVDNTDSIYSDSIEMANGTYRIKFSDPTINPADSAILIGMRSDISFLQRVNTFTLQNSIYTFITEQGTFEELIKTGVLNIGDAVNQALILDSPAMQKTRSSISQSTNSFPTRQTLKDNSNNKGIKLLYSQNTNENVYPKARSVSSLTNGDGFILSLPDISMFKIEGTFNASINNSFIRINPNFVLDYTYSFPANLTKLRFGVDNAEIEYNINSKLEVTAPIITNQEEKKIMGVSKYIVFMAGPVPVVITANFDIKASIALDASAGITLEQKKIYKTNITALVVGESVNSLTLIKNSSESSTHEEKLTGIAETSFEFNIGPEVSFKAYDFIGPYFKIPAKIKLSYCTNTNNNWSGEASIGYECTLGANAKVLGSTLFDFNYKFLKDDIMGNIKLPYQLELLSGNFQKGTNGNQLLNPISIRATSNLGFGVPFVPVRLTLEAGNGSVPQNVLYTDVLGNVSVNWTLGTNPQNKLKVSVLDCDDNDIENSPMYVYANAASQTYDCTNSSLSIDMKTVNGYMSPSVTGGTASYTYSTNGTDYSSTKPQFNILVPIKQTLFVKDKNLCIRSKTFEIKVVDACASTTLSMDVLVQPDILSITGKGGKTPYQFAVDNTASFTTTSTYYKLSAGKHTVYIKDSNGCIASHDVVIDNVSTTASIRASYPAQGATSIPLSPNTFQWTAATYVTNQMYDLYLKKGTDAYSLIASGLSSTAYTYGTALIASTAYTWKVAVKTGSTLIDYSEFTFTTASGVATTPTVPVLLQPGNGASVYSPATFKWTPQAGDFKYDLYLDANTASTLVALNLTTAECTVTNLVIGKTYYWKVKIKSSITGASATSAVRSFTVQNSGITTTDIDGNVYHTIKIGTQIWMVENLKTTRYRNGNSIANVTDNTSWSGLSTGAWCDYSNLAANGTKYGHLYNWYAASDSRKLAPAGWHVPSDAEWTTLENYLIQNGYNYDGTTTGNKIAKSLAATTDWYTYTGIATGTIGNDLTKNNTSGFTALPGGYRYGYGGNFDRVGYVGDWWSSTEDATSGARLRGFTYNYDLGLTSDYATKSYGFSVRCVRDTIPTVSDIDGNIYHTVQIGTQTWMLENLKTTRYRNGEAIGTTTPATKDIYSENMPKYQWAYNGDENMAAKYGRLYTWYAATDSRNIAPTGWHVASDAEWTTLENYLIANGYNYDGTTSGNKIAKSLAATTDWYTYTGTGTIGNDLTKNNTSGFSALPGGYRINGGTFVNVRSLGYWWSSTQIDTYNAWNRVMYYNYSYVNRHNYDKVNGFSVRCVRDY